jgi:hypothetical protein
MLRKQGIAAADLEPRAVAQARQAMLRAGIDVAELEGVRRHRLLLGRRGCRSVLRGRCFRSLVECRQQHAGRHQYLGQPDRVPSGGDLPPVRRHLRRPSPCQLRDRLCALFVGQRLVRRQDLVHREVSVAGVFAVVVTNTWDNQTASQAGATFRLFVDICGDRPLATYTRKPRSAASRSAA